MVPISPQLTAAGKLGEHVGFEQAGVGLDQVAHRRLEHQEAAVDPGLLAVSLLLKIAHAIAFEVQSAVAAGRLHRGEGGLQALLSVMGDQGTHIDIGHPIAIGEAEGLITEVGAHPAQAPTGFGLVASVDQRDLPGLGGALVHLHVVAHIHVEGDITGVQKIIRKIFLDHVTLVATAHDEIVDAKGAVDLEDVPEDRQATHFHQRLGPHHGFFGEAGAPATGEDDGFQRKRTDSRSEYTAKTPTKPYTDASSETQGHAKI
jgi:hypothetical protein